MLENLIGADPIMFDCGIYTFFFYSRAFDSRDRAHPAGLMCPGGHQWSLCGVSTRLLLIVAADKGFSWKVFVDTFPRIRHLF